MAVSINIASRLRRLLIASLVAVPVALPQMAAAQASSVQVEQVEIRATSDTTSVIGQFVASTQADVASRRPGVTVEVLFEIGDWVEANEPLVRLETTLTEIERRTLMADLAVARAGVQANEARLTQAMQALARQEQLKASTAFSKGSYEDLLQSVEEARGELSEAAARISAAEARIARVDYDLENAIIRAPFAGVVIERMAQPGQYVNLGEAVAKLLDFSGLEIEADVPVELVEGLQQGVEVELSFGDGRSASAQVRVLLPVETISTRTRPVRFTVDVGALDPMLLAVGNSATLQIPVSTPRDIITVPKDALVQGRDGGWIAFVVLDGKAEPRPLTLGQAAGGRMEVVDGLGPGELVVVRGNERLRPGQAVSAKPSGG